MSRSPPLPDLAGASEEAFYGWNEPRGGELSAWVAAAMGAEYAQPHGGRGGRTQQIVV